MRGVVGLTGPNASGKGEVARFLSSFGFSLHSLSDAVREEATRQGLDHTRDALIRTGTYLRERFGPGVLAERTLPHLGERSVVDSIRNPGEIEVLRGQPGFHLLGVDAPVEIRFQRSRLRGRSGDGDTLEEFMAQEQRERAGDGPGQQLAVCLALSDAIVRNDSTLEDLHRRVREALSGLGITLPESPPPTDAG
jgi:dephospho-CoA kinase